MTFYLKARHAVGTHNLKESTSPRLLPRPEPTTLPALYLWEELSVK